MMGATPELLSMPGPFSSAEVAELLGVHVNTVRAWCDSGQLASIVRSPGGHRRVTRQTLEAMGVAFVTTAPVTARCQRCARALGADR
jgi:excisionase family DNA binding protein